MKKCCICNKNFKNEFGLGKHIVQIHKITTKEYFDKFIKQGNMGICLMCGNPTFFEGLKLGYRKYCSIKCLSNDKNIIKKRKKTCLKKYGVDNPLKNDEIKNKLIESFKINYGVDNPSKSKEIQKRKERTCLQNYGVNNPSKSFEIIKKKRKKFIKVNKILEKNNIELVEYIENDFIKCKCSKGHLFTIRTHYLYLKDRNNFDICPVCYPKTETSNLEKQLFNFIKENYKNEVLFNKRNIIHPYELDIYLPDLKLAFEFNGLYWHSELYKDKNYHLIKTIKCEKQGIHLVHIYEDDWVYKHDIVKSKILGLLGNFELIDIKKTDLREVSYKDSVDFLSHNDISDICNFDYSFGLYHGSDLVLLMVCDIDNVSFCSKLNKKVAGGEKSLLQYFERIYSPIELVGYVDRSWHMIGKNIYDDLGFELDFVVIPGCFGIVDDVRVHLDDMDSYHRIYDSGQLKYKKIY